MQFSLSFLKADFILSLAMFAFVAMMVVSEDRGTRALLFLPVVLLFFTSKILYAMDKARQFDELLEKYRKGAKK